jgi:hypothetical protein
MSSQADRELEIVHVAGVDFDGCAYYKGRPGGEGEAHRELMVDFFQGVLAAINAQLVFDSSSRNDTWTELFNLERTGVAAVAQFGALVDDVPLHEGLLEDLWLQQEPGTTFGQVQAWLAENNIEANLASDTDAERDGALTAIAAKRNAVARVPSFKCKVAIIYLQMLQARYQFSGRQVMFHFYDDHVQVLSGLYDFFAENLGLIPPGVTLQLHQVTLSATRDQATQGVIVEGSVRDGFCYRVADADGNRPAGNDVEKLGEHAQLVSEAGGDVPAEEAMRCTLVEFVERRVALRVALQFVAAQPAVQRLPRPTLDHHEGLFGQALQAMLGLTDCQDQFEHLDGVLGEYQQVREQALPDDESGFAVIVNSRSRGPAGGHTYGQKIAACLALKAAFRMEDSEAIFDFIRGHYSAVLGQGSLGRQLAEQARSIVGLGRRCLFAPTHQMIVSRWLESPQMAVIAGSGSTRHSFNIE